ncbi:MAG: hypothetical protein ACRECV_06110 [Xanthobacteraceae bacterium]
MSAELDVKATLELVAGSPKGAFLAARRGKISAALSAAEVPDLRDRFPWAFAEGVVGLGVAEKKTAGKVLRGVIAFKVYVERKLPRTSVEHPIPPTIELPGLPPVDIDVEEIGKVVLQGNTQRIRPAIPGYSIGRAVDTNVAGTFGMLVRRRGEQNPLYLLSNSHAIAASGFAKKGDVIVQPGAYDGGKAPVDAIGTLADWVPLIFSATGFPNLVDVAIAELDPGIASPAIAVLGVPKGVNTNLTRGMSVQKMGRTTTLSVAVAQDVDFRVSSTYPDASGKLGRVGFSDQVLVTYYSSGGDSGSPVLDMENNIVGLHVAGSDTIGIFCKIANVVDQLGVDVVTQQNQTPTV